MTTIDEDFSRGLPNTMQTIVPRIIRRSLAKTCAVLGSDKIVSKLPDNIAR